MPAQSRRGRPKGSRNHPKPQGPTLVRPPSPESGVMAEEVGPMLDVPTMLPPPFTDGGGQSASDFSAPREQDIPDVAPRPAKRGSKTTQIEEQLTKYYGLLGLLINRANNYDAQAVMLQARSCARGWVEVGKKHPEIMAALELLCDAGPYTILITSHAAILIAVGANHGVFPAWSTQVVDMPPPPPRAEKEASGAGAKTAATAATAAAATAVRPRTARPETFSEPNAVPVTATGDAIPAEGLPADVELQIRQLAQTHGVPYEVLRAQVVSQMNLNQRSEAANGYDDQDRQARPEHNPALLEQLVRRQ